MHSLLYLVHDDVQVDVVEVEVEGEALQSFADDGDVEGLEGALAGHHLHALRLRIAHILYALNCLFKLIGNTRQPAPPKLPLFRAKKC
jgi:hypothetical protein